MRRKLWRGGYRRGYIRNSSEPRDSREPLLSLPPRRKVRVWKEKHTYPTTEVSESDEQKGEKTNLTVTHSNHFPVKTSGCFFYTPYSHSRYNLQWKATRHDVHPSTQSLGSIHYTRFAALFDFCSLWVWRSSAESSFGGWVFPSFFSLSSTCLLSVLA